MDDLKRQPVCIYIDKIPTQKFNRISTIAI